MRLPALRKDEGRICKAQFSVRSATCRRARVSVIAIAATARGRMASGSAWTANTTARIAGKPAKLAWHNPMTNPMPDEPVRVVFHLNQDWNLVGVFCCAVEFQAIHAGFETEAGAQLARAAGDVCRDTFSNRIEIAIHCRSQVLPVLGLETFAFSDAITGATGGLNGLELLSRVDRVLYNCEGGVARTTLVKFLPAHH